MRMLLVTLSIVALTSCAALAENPTAVKALIITGDHGHQWKETTPILKQILIEAGHTVDVTETPRLDLTPENLDTYDVLVLNYKDTKAGASENPDSVWSDANKKAFADAIHSGTGLVVYHHASSAFTDDSPWSQQFEEITAGGWRKQGHHGPMKEFTVTAQVYHPVMKGITSFQHGRDELYQNSLITDGSEVIVTAFDGDRFDEPVVWVNHYGKGRVVQNTLGHDPIAMEGEGFRKLMVNCVEWAGEKGFRMIFDGKTLDGWEGNLRYWSVENRAIVGARPHYQSMPVHDFLCTVEEFDDFELRLEAKVIGQRNSGVTVRTNKKRYSYPIEGYEIDMGIKLWGVIFEEGGTRGPVNRDAQEELQPKIDRVVRRGDFNDFVIRCEGNHIKAWLNGVYYDFVETDPQALKKLRSGTIGLQLHSGKPQIVSFRNIRVKELP